MEAQVKQPDYLYHYTSIETLALILNSKAIRFNRLNMVDDVTESQTADSGDLGRLSFVSCWTAEPQENIPLWSMYTDKMQGVRLRLPCQMFIPFDLPELSTEDPDLMKKISENDDLNQFAGKGYTLISAWMNQFIEPVEVEYTDDKNLLFPNAQKKTDKGYEFKLSSVGRHKKTVWRFQNEWRFILQGLPFDFKSLSDLHADPSDVSKRLQDGLINGKMPVEDVYIKLKQEALDTIEVMLGPMCSEAHKLLVSSLLDKFAPKGKLIESHLSGTIRR